MLVLLKLPAAHFRANQTYGGGYGDSAGQAARQRIAARLARQHGLAMVTNWPMPLVGVDCFVMQVPPGARLMALRACWQRRADETVCDTLRSTPPRSVW